MDPSDDVLRGLLAAAPDALVAVDARGQIVFASREAERLFGWTREELVGGPVERLVPERYAARHPALRAGYAAHPSTRPMGAGLELWARRKDGSEFPAEISLSTIDTPDGQLVAAAIRDVTVARRAEQRFRAVLASAPDAMIGITAAGCIEFVNGQAERLFGWPAEELIGRQIEALVPQAVKQQHIRHRAGYVADPQARPMGAGVQLEARRRDGTTFPADISLSSIRDEPGGGVLVLAAVRDVTERLEMEAERQQRALATQREQSHRLESLGQLAGGIAHDFNNLLGVILNYSTLLAGEITDSTALGDVAEISAAAERAAGLTRQLLTFARRDVTHPAPLDLNEVVRGVASMLQRTLGEHIALSIDLAAAPLVAVADRNQIEQIVVNLALNARDAMPDGGLLRIATESHGDRLVLAVTDTGRGMTPDVAARAFEPFFTTKPTGAGTGLGLATVYGIVRAHGGEVDIRSTPDAGTTVTVSLPVAVETSPAAAAEPGELVGGRERILLVEDEEALRVGTARLLEEQGYDVEVAGDGVEAMEVVLRDNGSIDAVVTDVAMPRLRGDEFARWLAQRRPDVPVIFVSGYDSGDVSMMGRLLSKPVHADVLLRAIREALDS